MSTFDPRWHGSYDRVLLAQITGVDADAGTVQIEFLDQFGARDNVPIPVLAMSHDCWMRFIPQIQDIVEVGIRGDEQALILNWFPYAYKQRIEAFNKNEKSLDKSKFEMMQKLEPGEFDLYAKGGGYLRMKNSGDVLLMGSGGNRLQLFGQENYNQLTQNALKITTGFSWLRFGVPFRIFTGKGEREQPAGGAGLPASSNSKLIERDSRLVDPDTGLVLVRETLGDVIDENGNIALTGEIGSIPDDPPSTTSYGSQVVGTDTPSSLANVTDTLRNLGDNVANTATGAINGQVPPTTVVADQVFDKANQTITQLVTNIAPIVAGPGAGDLGDLVEDTAALTEGLTGLGTKGKKVRYRLMINQKGKRVFGCDISEEGGIVQSNEEDYNVNVNQGGMIWYALKKIYQICAGPIVYIAQKLSINLEETLEITSTGNQVQASAASIEQHGEDVKRTATNTISDDADVSVTLSCASGASTITMTATGITINTTGAVNVSSTGNTTVSATGTCNISGSTVNIN